MFWENIGNSLKQSNVHDSLITVVLIKVVLGKKVFKLAFLYKIWSEATQESFKLLGKGQSER